MMFYYLASYSYLGTCLCHMQVTAGASCVFLLLPLTLFINVQYSS